MSQGAAITEMHGEAVLSRFANSLARAGQGVFMLDYDGTLAPFALDPGSVRPYAGVPEAIDALMNTGRARVVIVTGRYLKTAPPLLDLKRKPEFWGSHGRERLRPDGTYKIAEIDEFAVRGLTVADGWVAAIEALGGRCEPKPGSLAIHWRGAGMSQTVKLRQLLARNFHAEALEDILEWRNFDGGVELRAPGPGKGDVVRTVLAEMDASIPAAYLGDDFTDEDAFSALSGRGLTVLVRPEFRGTAAGAWVRPPDGLLGLLRQWHDALCGSG